MRCQFLNRYGNRCKRKAVYVETRDYDMGYNPKWCVVFMCGHHSEEKQDSEWYIGRVDDLGIDISPNKIWDDG